LENSVREGTTTVLGEAHRSAEPEQRKLRWRALSLLLRTLGRTSDGIALGYRHGFDSGRMLDYVYENRVRGRLLIGRLVDRLYLDNVGWRAIRRRKALLQEVLAAEIFRRRAAEPASELAILDVAAGPGRYLLDLLEVVGPDNVAVTCRDLDLVALEHGRKLAQARGLRNIRYEPGDACDPRSLATAQPTPDLIVASGLYELLDPDSILRSMRGIASILRPGGLLVFSTQVAHPQLELIAQVLPNRDGRLWVMENRPLPTVETWVREAGFAEVTSRLEPTGIFAVTSARKPA
jgi:SAM-dependent methyltransferase